LAGTTEIAGSFAFRVLAAIVAAHYQEDRVRRMTVSWLS
jgi:hypothetical protein